MYVLNYGEHFSYIDIQTHTQLLPIKRFILLGKSKMIHKIIFGILGGYGKGVKIELNMWFEL